MSRITPTYRPVGQALQARSFLTKCRRDNSRELHGPSAPIEWPIVVEVLEPALGPTETHPKPRLRSVPELTQPADEPPFEPRG